MLKERNRMQHTLSKLRSNFSGENLVCGKMFDGIDTTLDEIMTEVIDSVSELLNIPSHVKPFSSWNGDEAHQCNGSIINLLRGNIDLVIGSNFPMEYDRQTVTIHPLIRNSISCMYYLDVKSFQSRGLFWSPFSAVLLTSVATMCALISLVTLTVSCLSVKPHHKPQESKSKLNRKIAINYRSFHRINMISPIGAGDFLMWFITSMTSQEGVRFPKARSGRILLICALFFSFIICNTYSGSIASFLSIKVSPIRNIHDILKNDNFDVGFVAYSRDEQRLKSSKNEILQTIYKRSLSNNRNIEYSATTAIRRVISGGYAVFLGRRAARAALSVATHSVKRCQVSEMPIDINDGQLAVAILKDSPLNLIIHHFYLRSLETGVEQHMKNKFMGEMPRCNIPQNLTHIKIDDVYPAFILLAYGAITSLLLCFFENVWYKIKHRRIIPSTYFRRRKRKL